MGDWTMKLERTKDNSRSQSLGYPTVNDELLREIVRRICSVGNPEKIVLFGSYARNDARPDSDLDLLIIEDTDAPRHRRAVRYRMALLGLHPSKDIVVWTPSEAAQWRNAPNAFITTILSEGKVLYERSDNTGAGMVAEGAE